MKKMMVGSMGFIVAMFAANMAHAGHSCFVKKHGEFIYLNFEELSALPSVNDIYDDAMKDSDFYESIKDGTGDMKVQMLSSSGEMYGPLKMPLRPTVLGHNTLPRKKSDETLKNDGVAEGIDAKATLESTVANKEAFEATGKKFFGCSSFEYYSPNRKKPISKKNGKNSLPALPIPVKKPTTSH